MFRHLAATVGLLALPAHLVAQVEPQDTTPQVLPTIEVHGASPSRYQQRSTRTATKTDDPASRRPPVGHRHHQGRDRRPADAEHGRRGAVHPRRHHGAGRGQPRPAHDPGQQHHRRVLRRRHAGRRPVLPRSLQRRAGRGAEGRQRADLRPGGRRRRAQPGDQGGGLDADSRAAARRAAPTATGAPRWTWGRGCRSGWRSA